MVGLTKEEKNCMTLLFYVIVFVILMIPSVLSDVAIVNYNLIN